eukprot:3330651-Rhodomonas_salina.1
MRQDQLAELLRGLNMEEPPDRERTRRDEVTPRRAVRFVEVPEEEPREELRTVLDEVHDLPGMEEDFRGYRRCSSMASTGTDQEYYSGSRPKLEKPWTFEGHYSELAWLDARFPDADPSWEAFCKALIERYLPTDHDVMVEL